MAEEKTQIRLFEEQKVRTIWNAEEEVKHRGEPSACERDVLVFKPFFFAERGVLFDKKLTVPQVIRYNSISLKK